MTRFDDDRELDEFLARRSALHRRLAEPDHAEPPPELDRLVLDEAREAIRVPANVPLYRAPRWALPVSLAATVVLALAIVVNYARMQPGTYPVAASASPAADAAPAAADAEPLSAAPAAPPVTPEVAPLQKSAESFAAEPALAPPPELRRQQRPGPSPASSKGARVLYAPNEARRVIVPARSEAVLDTGALENVEVSAQRRGGTESVPASALTAATTDAAAVTPAAQAAARENAKRADPRAWLREIERLRAAGRGAEAERELAEFRKAFPGEAVPAAARDTRPSR